MKKVLFISSVVLTSLFLTQNNLLNALALDDEGIGNESQAAKKINLCVACQLPENAQIGKKFQSLSCIYDKKQQPHNFKLLWEKVDGVKQWNLDAHVEDASTIVNNHSFNIAFDANGKLKAAKTLPPLKVRWNNGKDNQETCDININLGAVMLDEIVQSEYEMRCQGSNFILYHMVNDSYKLQV